jgi:ABC-type lipoprotein release transport system permease subunit
MWRLYPVIAVRSDASQSDGRFAEAFEEAMTGHMRAGNFFFRGLLPYGEMAKDTAARFGITSALNMRVYLMVFFLLNILLCVMGTFWYRVNVRTGETGIRKALGSSSRGIRSIFLLEGLCLLTAAMLPAMFIEFQFVHADLIDTFGRTETNTVCLPDRMLLRFLITNGITWVMMVAVIIAAIWIPARRAAAMPVAEALRHE